MRFAVDPTERIRRGIPGACARVHVLPGTRGNQEQYYTFEMAEAVIDIVVDVDEDDRPRPAASKFFCHSCNVEIDSVSEVIMREYRMCVNVIIMVYGLYRLRMTQ